MPKPTPQRQSSAVLTTEAVRQLTGWTERHLRDLAKAGWFPKADHGKYETVATIKGIIDYLKDQVAKKDDTEKKARAAYWETKRQREAFDFAQDQKQFVAVGELNATTRNVLIHFAASLRRKLELELPGRLRNKTEIEMREEMKRAVDGIFKVLREGLSRWLV